MVVSAEFHGERSGGARSTHLYGVVSCHLTKTTSYVPGFGMVGNTTPTTFA
jgi:hypothetical protein